jgi:hypothetical protein
MTAAAAALMAVPAAGFAEGTGRDRAGAMDNQGDRATTALNLLEANGYTSFSNFQPAGRDFQVTVIRDGRPTVVTVDPDSGRITPQTAVANQPSSTTGYSGSSTPPAAQPSGAGTAGGSAANRHRDSSSTASQVYHDFYNPEGGAGPTQGPEAARAKKD